MMRHETLARIQLGFLGLALGSAITGGYHQVTSFAHDKDARIISGDAAHTEQSLSPQIDTLAQDRQEKATYAVLGMFGLAGTAGLIGLRLKHRSRI